MDLEKLGWRECTHLGAVFVPNRWRMARTPRWDPDRMRAWQLERIQKLVSHAFQHVPLYRERYRALGFDPRALCSWEDFARLPVVTKEELLNASPDGVVAETHARKRLFFSRTSGSGGKMLQVRRDPASLMVFIEATLRMYGMIFPYRPWHRMLYTAGAPFPVHSFLGLYRCRYIHNAESIDLFARAIREYRPHLLVLFSGLMRQLIAELPGGQLAALGVRGVSVNSEQTSLDELALFSREAGCPVQDEYSSEELSRMATQCAHGSYHVCEDVNYLETCDEQGRSVSGEGTVVGTNLHNWAMPFIRYSQDDIAELVTAACSCGCQFRRLQRLVGRLDHDFILPSGRRLAAHYIIISGNEFFLPRIHQVRLYNVIQERRDLVRILIVPNRGFTSDLLAEAVAHFQKAYGPEVRVVAETAERGRTTLSGKRRIFWRLCD